MYSILFLSCLFSFFGAEIIPSGSCMPLDEEGYVLNVARKDCLQSKWIAIIEELSQQCQERWGPNLQNIYVRGSIARGAAIDGLSDVDLFVLVTEKNENDAAWKKTVSQEILTRYPFATSIDLEIVTREEIFTYPWLGFLFKTQSLCVYGVDMLDDLPRYKPSKEIALYALDFEDDIAIVRKKIQEMTSASEIRNQCFHVMKKILRTCFELLIDQEHQYTKDLYCCYAYFSKYYPEKDADLMEVLEYAINPTSDVETILRISDAWRACLGPKIRELYGSKD